MTTSDFNCQPKFICLVISLVNMSFIAQAHATDIENIAIKESVSNVINVNIDTAKNEEETVEEDSALSNNKSVDSVSLQSVVVKGKRRLRRKDSEVTGLGKIVKSSDDLGEQQVLGIRDLTRYDPGISVIEQGRGATSGYAIRGVDKNRVSLLVDDIPQIQSYVMRNGVGRGNGSQYHDFVANSGAINEIEYENIQAIEISKGANSAESGSGALGGSVRFRTKESGDIIKEGQNWGLNTKSAYSSKNKQLLNSISVAGATNGFDALAIYTKRSENEVSPHSAAKDRKYIVYPIGVYTEKYDLREPSNTISVGNWYVDETECPELVNCEPKSYLSFKKDNYEIPDTRNNVPLTPEERADYEKRIVEPVEMNADEYTGDLRTMPNPMDKKNDSLLLKGGYRISPEHYIGAVYENTNQTYNIRDMSQASYHPFSKLSNLNLFSKGLYNDDKILQGAVYKGTVPRSLYWSQAKFIDEEHAKKRMGLHYDYKANDNDNFVDSARLSYDHQKIDTETHLLKLYCSKYPVIDKNCLPSLDKPWSGKQTGKTNYAENHNLLKLTLDKTIKIGNQKHRLNATLGGDKFSSKLHRYEANAQYIQMNDLDEKNDSVKDASNERKGSITNPWVEGGLKPELINKNQCYDSAIRDPLACKPRNIDGYNYFAALRDNISIGKKVDLSLGVRYDKNKFDSDEPLTQTGSFENWSWNGGVLYKPTNKIDLSYRISNGFRVPSFSELYGIAFDGATEERAYRSNLTPEKSLNQELGAKLKGNFGYIETSYFINDYKDLIDTARYKEVTDPDSSGYHNLHDIKLAGINVLAKFDGNSIHDSIPEGIYATAAYNEIHAKSRGYDENKFVLAYDPVLDAIQPGRYVIGLGYDAPSEKWGVNWNTTYSQAKNNDEVTAYSTTSKKSPLQNQHLSKSWFIHDLVGYVKLKDNFTLRAGVYNILNRKYSTWESVRQSGLNAINQDVAGSNDNQLKGLRYAAPGINVTASLEMKF